MAGIGGGEDGGIGCVGIFAGALYKDPPCGALDLRISGGVPSGSGSCASDSGGTLARGGAGASTGRRIEGPDAGECGALAFIAFTMSDIFITGGSGLSSCDTTGLGTGAAASGGFDAAAGA